MRYIKNWNLLLTRASLWRELASSNCWNLEEFRSSLTDVIYKTKLRLGFQSPSLKLWVCSGNIKTAPLLLDYPKIMEGTLLKLFVINNCNFNQKSSWFIINSFLCRLLGLSIGFPLSPSIKISLFRFSFCCYHYYQ